MTDSGATMPYINAQAYTMYGKAWWMSFNSFMHYLWFFKGIQIVFILTFCLRQRQHSHFLYYGTIPRILKLMPDNDWVQKVTFEDIFCDWILVELQMGIFRLNQIRLRLKHFLSVCKFDYIYALMFRGYRLRFPPSCIRSLVTCSIHVDNNKWCTIIIIINASLTVVYQSQSFAIFLFLKLTQFWSNRNN